MKEEVLPVPSKGWGAEFFGFAHPAVHNLIQNSTGSRKCVHYRWIRYEQCRSADSRSVTPQWKEDNVYLSFKAFQKHLTNPRGRL